MIINRLYLNCYLLNHVLAILFLFTAFNSLIADDRTKGDQLPNLYTLWDFDDPAATESKFRELVPMAKTSGNLDYHLQLLTQVARSLVMQNKLDRAHSVLDTVEQMLTARTKLARVHYLMERGRVFITSGSTAQSKPLLQEAYDISLRERFDGLALEVVHLMGNAVPTEERLDWYLNALEAAEAVEDNRLVSWSGSLLYSIGWAYYEREDFEKALEFFAKSYSRSVSGGNEVSARIAEWSMGKIYRLTGRIDDAIRIQHNIVEKVEEKKLKHSGLAHEELGELYLIKGDKDQSRKYFKLAYEILSQDPELQLNEKVRLERMNELGE